MSLTAMPDSRSSLAVPPVEMSSMPRPESWRPKSTRPVLSVTLRIARWMREVLRDMIGLGYGRLVRSDRRFYQQSVDRSEEHTSELQSPDHLVCRLLLEKKKTIHYKDLPQI